MFSRFRNTCCLNHYCDETNVDRLLAMFSVMIKATGVAKTYTVSCFTWIRIEKLLFTKQILYLHLEISEVASIVVCGKQTVIPSLALLRFNFYSSSVEHDILLHLYMYARMCTCLFFHKLKTVCLILPNKIYADLTYIFCTI